MDRKYVYFDFNDFVGNLFITLRLAGFDVNKVSYNLIQEYTDILYAELRFIGFAPIDYVNRDEKYAFLDQHCDLYQEVDNDHLVLKRGVTTEELIENYCGVLNLDVIKVIRSDKFVLQIIDAYEREFKNEYQLTLDYIDSRRKHYERKRNI